MEVHDIWRIEAVLVLAIFTQGRPISEFLTLLAGSGQIDAQRFEVGSQLSWGLELNAAQAKTSSGLHIGRYVVNIHGFLGLDFEGAKSFPVDDRSRFAGAHRAGINANGKESEKAVSGFHMPHVNGVGIGEEGKAIAFGQFFEEGVLENGSRIQDAIPNFSELLEGEVTSKALSQMEVPIAGRDTPLLPVVPARILLDGRP